jgi:hypothetical protein
MHFDGTTGFMYVPAAIYVNSQSAFSLEWWVNNTLASLGVMNSSSTPTVGTGAGGAISIRVSVGGNVIGALAATAVLVTDPTPSNNGQWHHYVYAYDGGPAGTGLLLLYRDGRLASQTTITGSPGANAGQRLQVGFAGTSFNGFFNGNLSQVSLYQRALPLSEIQAHFNNIATPTAPTVARLGNTNTLGRSLVQSGFGKPF